MDVTSSELTAVILLDSIHPVLSATMGCDGYRWVADGSRADLLLFGNHKMDREGSTPLGDGTMP